MHGRDDGHVERLVTIEQGPILDFARRPAELADVGARKERGPFAQEDDRADPGICAQGLECRAEPGADGGGDRIDRRIAGDDERELAVTFDANAHPSF